MNCKAWIEDGCTLDGFVKAERGMYPDVHFKYRPLTATERATVMKKINDSSAAEGEIVSAKMIAGRVLEWDIEGRRADQTLEITADNCLRLKPRLLARLYWIITGDQPSDIQIEDDTQPTQDDSEQSFTRLIEGN